ncbi:hypothetical protein PCLA_06r0165 [Pseudomonas citronellolis]|nr:hypothetical protein PCLA_06r0165 [Pseudomonas citronellolis]
MGCRDHAPGSGGGTMTALPGRAGTAVTGNVGRTTVRGCTPLHPGTSAAPRSSPEHSGVQYGGRPERLSLARLVRGASSLAASRGQPRSGGV